MVHTVFDKLIEVRELRLVLESGKQAIVRWYFATVLMFILTLHAVYGWMTDTSGREDMYGYWFITAFCLIMTIYLLLLTTVESRTIVLTEEGCEIIWWKYRKFWKWDELKHRQWIPYSLYIHKVSPQDGYGVIWLSHKKAYLPWFANASNVAALRPLSRVGIHLLPNNCQLTSERHGFSFPVDKDVFMRFCKSISLQIEDIDEAKCMGDPDWY